MNPQTYEWRCKASDYDRYRSLLGRYTQYAYNEDHPEAVAIRDEIASLPGFPQVTNEDDVIIPVFMNNAHSGPRLVDRFGKPFH